MEKGSCAKRSDGGILRIAPVLPVLSLFVLISTLSTDADADSFRCGKKVIRSGDSSSALLQNCGQPRLKDSGYEMVRLSEGRKKIRVQRWHYKKSSRSLERIVMVYRGHIVAIRTGQR
jgi:hypothetical protein